MMMGKTDSVTGHYNPTCGNQAHRGERAIYCLFRHTLTFKGEMVESAVQGLLAMLAVPQVGLTSVFIVCLISATLIPMASEPAVFAVAAADGSLFWQVVLVGTAGNTIGGIINYWIGYGAHQAFAKERKSRWFSWLERYGPKTMLLSWLPGVGDPICTLAGWLKLAFWPSVGYMAIGKFLRYTIMTWALLHIPQDYWRQFARWLG